MRSGGVSAAHALLLPQRLAACLCWGRARPPTFMECRALAISSDTRSWLLSKGSRTKAWCALVTSSAGFFPLAFPKTMLAINPRLPQNYARAGMLGSLRGRESDAGQGGMNAPVPI